MTPDRAMFERDLAAAPFLEGVARKRWALVTVSWPFALFAITARDGEIFHLRMNLEGYPAALPTGGLWDPATDAILGADRWPKGDAVFNSVFRRDWQGATTLYFPLDRVALNGHHDWPANYPHLRWQPEKGFVQYLGETHRLLNSRGYHGI
jgi:hypothetical protein